MYMWPNQEYKIVIGNKTKQGFVEIKRKTADLRDSSVSYDKGTYQYTQESFNHHKGRFHFAYYDKTSAAQLLMPYGEVPSDVNAEDSDTRNARGLVKAAINSVNSNMGLAMVVMAGLLGLCGGAVLGIVVAPMVGGETAKLALMLVHP